VAVRSTFVFSPFGGFFLQFSHLDTLGMILELIRIALRLHAESQ
jgi:hypothetical protein